MKKLLLTLAIVMTIGFSANAQHDGFIQNDAGDYAGSGDRSTTLPMLPEGRVGIENGDQSATPLGSGLLIMAALGAGYAVARRNTRMGK